MAGEAVPVIETQGLACPDCGGIRLLDFRAAFARFDGAEPPPEGPELPDGVDKADTIANACAPPKQPEPGRILTFIGFAIGIAAAYWVETRFHFVLLSGAVFIGVQILGYFAWHSVLAGPRMRRYRDKRAIWERSWLCTRCGRTFEAGGGEA